MNIKEKLQLIESFSRAFHPIESPHEKSDIEEFIQGEYHTTPFGPCFVVTKYFDDHGAISFAKTDHVTAEMLALLGKDDRLLQMDLERTVFFDTETTGLSSGTGTHIFLAGFGYFANSGFTIKQFFLRDFNEELAFLDAINQFLKNFTAIVSYNGKSFDYPLLQTRFIYSRMNCVFVNPLHLDLVHTTRRIWKRRLGDCSLVNIEQNILDFNRIDDIPSFLIPQIYFQYLRNKNPQPLLPVFQHNALDVLSIAALLIKCAAVYHAPIEFLAEHQDLISLARTFDSMKQWQRSIFIYENLLRNFSDRDIKKHAALRLSYGYKRLGMLQQAAQLWQEIIADGISALEPYIELAKYYEHHLRDYANAKEIIHRAFNVLEILEQLRDDSELNFYKDSLNYRLKRIIEKLKRRERHGGF